MVTIAAATSPIGRLTKNAQRQLKVVDEQPADDGPIRLATAKITPW